MSSPSPSPMGDRLAKVMARAGVCSRREAESWISAGRVAVNGETVKTPAINVTDADTIAVDGKPLARREETQAWIYHKPAGLMVTERDPEGRPTVFEQFETLGLPRVLTVGRLDFTTEGLLILTNDGGLKRTLELPATGWVRRYRVRAFGAVTQEQLDGLARGISVDGVDYGPIEASLDSAKGSNVWLTLGLREGKNREVRNVLGALGLEVNRLIRISYGPFQLGDLPEGAVEKIKTRVLKDQLGKRLSEQSGAEFTGEADAGNAPRRRTPEKPPSRPPERDRYTGLRRRPERENRERPVEPPRTVHFDDGRPSESFTPTPPKRGRDDARPERGARPDGPRGERPERGARPERPARSGGFDKRGGDRPSGNRPPHRDGDKPFAKGPRRDGDKPIARGPRKDGDRPFADRPPRREGEKPFAKGPRRDGDKPFSRGPRREDGDRPTGDRPPRRDGGKPFAKGPGGKGSFAKGPSGKGSFGKGPGGKGPRRDGDNPVARGPRRETPAGGRPPRADANTFEKRGERPARAKPYTGRPGNPAPDRGESGRADARKPFGNKPAGGKPSGGKPSSSRGPGQGAGNSAVKSGAKRPYTGAPGSSPRSGGPRSGSAPRSGQAPRPGSGPRAGQGPKKPRRQDD